MESKTNKSSDDEIDWRDWRQQPIENRKSLHARPLGDLLRKISLNEHFEEDGAIVFRESCKLREGIVSKRIGTPYRSGRSINWVKVKNLKAPAVKREADEDWVSPHWVKTAGRQQLGAGPRSNGGI
jgi:ATP-dependent DNA ligase